MEQTEDRMERLNDEDGHSMVQILSVCAFKICNVDTRSKNESVISGITLSFNRTEEQTDYGTISGYI